MCTPFRYDSMEQLGKQSVSCLSVRLSLLAASCSAVDVPLLEWVGRS